MKKFYVIKDKIIKKHKKYVLMGENELNHPLLELQFIEHFPNGYNLEVADVNDKDFQKYVNKDIKKIQEEIDRKVEILEYLKSTQELL